MSPRPPLIRSTDRVIAGVCSGLAEHLGWPVSTVRLVMALSSFLFGSGLLLYFWLWALVPEASATQRTASGPAQLLDSGRELWRRRGVKEAIIGIVLVLAAVFFLAQSLGANLQLGAVGPFLVIGAGAVLVWMQLDASRRAALLNSVLPERDQQRSPLGIFRLVAGLVLVALGVIVLVTGGGGWDRVLPAIIAAFAVLAGVGLVLTPWALRLWRDLQEERAARVRETERAEIAAHLHDSVLQTLALIQRKAGSEQEVLTLARAQERELRDWIYQDASRNPQNLTARLKSTAAELEATHGVAVELIAVGDAVMDSSVEALVQASREAILNSVRHAGTAVSVYLEATAELAEVFVRDRGPGFELSAVSADRLGVRESIIGRMSRHGGTASIRSSEEGTEVHLSMPLRAAEMPGEGRESQG
ncbi:PspC domain-containing protein [Psychromicrobium sp. YIM B11713]|uniref:PspC domain-containing protein n=1 Tax=Psychromicrobium sp. YIM B11713 TaxID=3145233 RepID=UPI00374EEA9B